MSANPCSSVLRSGLTRRLWPAIALAMLIPVGLSEFSRWFEADERLANLRSRGLMTLSRAKASGLLFIARGLPSGFARGLDGRQLALLDGVGSTRYSSSPVPQELVQLFERSA